MNQDLLYCNRQGHSKAITFVCVKRDCQLLSPCCNQCISEVHLNHSTQDFIELEVAVQQGKILKNYYFDLINQYQSLKQICTNFIYEIGHLIEKYSIHQERPNLTQLNLIVKQLKAVNLEQKASKIMNCFNQQKEGIKEKFRNIVQCLTQELQIDIEDQLLLIKQQQRKNKIEQNIKYSQLKLKNLRFILKGKLDRHGKDIGCLAISQNDKIIASGGDDDKIILWNVQDMTMIREYKANNFIYALIFSPNNELLIAAQYETILLFKLNAIELKPFQLLKGHTHSIMSFAMTNDSKYLISGSWDETIKIWNIEKHKITQTYHLQQFISGVIISNNEKFLGCYCLNGFVFIFDCSNVTKLQKLVSLKLSTETNVMEFSPDSTSILIIQDGTIQLWSIISLFKNRTVKLIRRINQSQISYSKLSTYGSILCFGNREKLWIANYGTMEVIQTFEIELKGETRLVLTQDMKYIFASNRNSIFSFEMIQKDLN